MDVRKAAPSGAAKEDLVSVVAVADDDVLSFLLEGVEPMTVFEKSSESCRNDLALLLPIVTALDFGNACNRLVRSDLSPGF